MPVSPATQKQPSSAPTSVTRGAFWLGLDRALRLGVGFLVGVLVIRHLGPENNGLLQSGLALAAILGTGVELGLESIVRRELVRHPDRSGPLLGTATVLRLAALIPAGLAFLLIYHWQTRGQQVALGLLLATTLVLPLMQILDTWLLANDRMKESTLAGGTAVGSSALLRIGLLIGGANLVAFGAATAVETLFVGGCLWLWYRRSQNRSTAWSFDRSAAGPLLRDAAPLLFTNLAILVYRRIDLLLVAGQLNEHSAGIYAAAVKLTELGYVLPMILVNAWFPRLTKLHAAEPARYAQELARFYRLVTWLGVAFAATGSILAPWLIPLVLGRAFAETVMPFILYSWTTVFIAQGIARSQWLLLENKLGAGLALAVAGAAVNLGLNLLLIPRLGLNGAALSAVIALALNLGVFTGFSRHTRPAWSLGWRALLLRPPSEHH